MKKLAAQVALVALSMLLGSALTLDAVRQVSGPQTQVAHFAAINGSSWDRLGPIAQLEGGAQPASAQSLGVLMQCISAIAVTDQNGNVTGIHQHCNQAVGDTSGLVGVSLDFTTSSNTQRYAVGVSGTVTLP